MSLDVVDSDGHILEPADLWTGPYMPEAYRDRGPSISMDDCKLHYADGRLLAYDRSWAGTGALGFDLEPGVAERYTDGRPGASDPDGRIEDLDLEGIDAAVLYPTVGLAQAYEDDVPLAAAMARAYNAWIAEWCGAHPDRLFGAAMIPSQSVESAIEELHYARDEIGLPAAMVRPHAYKGRAIHSVEWDPFWAEAQDLDCPIALHGGTAWPTPQAGADRFTDDESELRHVIIHPFEQQLAFVGLIRTGVFERFPKLRVAFLESGGGWVVPLLDRMERHYDQDRPKFSRPKTPKRPREYFEQSCWISFEPVERSLGFLAEHIGPERILWATDYPHSDGFFPGALAQLEQSMQGCTEADKAAILGGGARAFYGI